MKISTRTRQATAPALLILAAVSFLACDLLGTAEAPRLATHGALTPTRGTLTPAPGTAPITIYLPRLFEDDSLGLRGVSRHTTPSADPLRDALDALIRGPTGDERAANFQYALHRRTRVVVARIEGGTATVELDGELQRVHGRPSSELVYWSIVYTLTDVVGVERLALQQNGAPLAELGDPPFAVPPLGTRAAAPSWARPR